MVVFSCVGSGPLEFNFGGWLKLWNWLLKNCFVLDLINEKLCDRTEFGTVIVIDKSSIEMYEKHENSAGFRLGSKYEIRKRLKNQSDK